MELKIGLYDADYESGRFKDQKERFPNLALMKISAYHKKSGDYVEWANAFCEYDKVYISKIFSDTPDINTAINAKEIIRGGVGYGVENDQWLNDEIEHMYPDYELYETKKAYGFMTRGCFRNCEFCNVSQHQGNKSIKVADLSEFWRGQKEIVLLDPNVLACSEWREIFQQLINSKAWIDFSQGIDIRLMTEEKALMIKKMKIDIVHFAWDFMKNSTEIIEKLKMFKRVTNMNRRKTCVYVLTNFDTTHQEDLFRVYALRNMDYDPYVMIYDKSNAPQETRHLQRWVNNKIIWRTVEKFENYNPKMG